MGANKANPSRVIFEIKKIEDMVRFNVIHGDLEIGSEMASKISTGWPRVLSTMKIFLETNKALNTWARHESSRSKC